MPNNVGVRRLAAAVRALLFYGQGSPEFNKATTGFTREELFTFERLCMVQALDYTAGRM